jgi:hypothetical protein
MVLRQKQQSNWKKAINQPWTFLNENTVAMDVYYTAKSSIETNNQYLFHLGATALMIPDIMRVTTSFNCGCR